MFSVARLVIRLVLLFFANNSKIFFRDFVMSVIMSTFAYSNIMNDE